MKKNLTFWLVLCPLAISCGYVGIDGLEQEQLDGAEVIGPVSGGKAGDGDVGDGDLGGGDLGGGDGDLSLGGAGVGTGGSQTGGSDPGTGGNDTNTGGSEMGTGGIWESDDTIWSDPNREGCWPFCDVDNSSFSTHFLFEQAVVPGPGVESNGTLSISTEYANWGISSLAVHVEGSPAHAYMPTEIVTDDDSGIFVRAWLYVPSDAITGDVGLLDFLSGDIPAARIKTHPEARLSVEAPLSQVRAMSKAATYPFDEWFCLRAAVYTDDLDGSVTVEAGDVVVAEILDADTRGLVDVNTVNFGITSAGPHQGPGDIYWDSLVIDQDPVACDDMSVPL